jgi:hypothetical protein
MYVLIIKNLYTILKNMYIQFEKYDMSTRMNGNGRTSMDGRWWTDVFGWSSVDKRGWTDKTKKMDVDECQMQL